MVIYHRTSFPALRKIKQAPVLRNDRGGKRTAAEPRRGDCRAVPLVKQASRRQIIICGRSLRDRAFLQLHELSDSCFGKRDQIVQLSIGEDRRFRRRLHLDQ